MPRFVHPKKFLESLTEKASNERISNFELRRWIHKTIPHVDFKHVTPCCDAHHCTFDAVYEGHVNNLDPSVNKPTVPRTFAITCETHEWLLEESDKKPGEVNPLELPGEKSS